MRMNNEDRLQSVAGAHDQWRECVCKNIGNNFGLGMEEHAWDCYGIRLWSLVIICADEEHARGALVIDR